MTYDFVNDCEDRSEAHIRLQTGQHGSSIRNGAIVRMPRAP